MTNRPNPFAQFAPSIRPASPRRSAITAATRKAEPDCIADLIGPAESLDENKGPVRELTMQLVARLRKQGQRGGVEALVKEYSLSSQEGVALMCLAEALLRIPDDATRDALIRDKIAPGDWQSHLGGGRSIFVNAATWGLVVTGKLTASVNDKGLSAALTRLVARAGEPVIRRGVDLAMELMGEQFVTGETIAEALRRSAKMEAKGFSYSFDMLGEAAMTAQDAARYYADYERAIAAIGKASNGRGVYAGPGISIKLSALHPRYVRAQADRVMAELLPTVRELALQARQHDIGFNIDAEEADRLELSLDILESLATDPALIGWNGLGFVVQAYGKRCPFVIDWLADLARRSDRRIMVRLVKGAYWDSEIKRAQVDGQADFPVFTRKVHTDVSYLACARKLLDNRAVLFPQFATHNAQTLSAIYHMAGPDFAPGDWEFQCLHGMGEPLYEQVVGAANLNRPCRIYAPVGTHETLLAYLVRRLLENGANSSFVHRIWDEHVALEDLAADPVAEAKAIEPLGAPHPQIALPRDMFADRRNSAGIDLSNESELKALADCLKQSADAAWRAQPLVPGLDAERKAQPVTNPADQSDVVGKVHHALERDAVHAMQVAARAAPRWAAAPLAERAACLDRAADAMEAAMPVLMGLIMREAGKTAANAVAEVREAVDFLRYYAVQAREGLTDTDTLGPVVCISPWNFPLAIFTGQVAAALVAGNPVLAKPAEETPLIAAQAVQLMHDAGVPIDVLQFLPGGGDVGAALVAAPQTAGVVFTGSTEVAKLIQRELASRLSATGGPIPLIAETGGQNAMIVDSSALAEQVVADVIASAFDSAGQRCSALRVLCLQEDIADRQLAMIRGALQELCIGNPVNLSTDVGPVITAEAKRTIDAHVARMASEGCRVERLDLPEEAAKGTFVTPTIIEIGSIAQLGREVFGPVLHVVRYKRRDLGKLVAAINATGYGLTFGLHTRLDETVRQVIAHVAAGNLYVNRNTIGAVVGVQPFGGRGLSGTGPKAGGPLYLGRLSSGASTDLSVGDNIALPGPVGEANTYSIHPREHVLLVPETRAGLEMQLGAVAQCGGTATVLGDPADYADLTFGAEWIADLPKTGNWGAALVEKPSAETFKSIAAMDGPIPLVQSPDADGGYNRAWLLEEVCISVNTTAAGGNASLMSLD
ncbi:bifunctional proline dehydrogenase/L-glutamate gamma-semialdehyde dehydrogenase PutA [Croceicoccus naphthovorans]|uniref:Bifunctional protein PutA n=1 Tax=Croceicoccus naphthovorans TaxID=1348774 RepID=A0A0G3XFU2_9SPHN|nr:bifunctional proline dehydrogenase/L-glutamate gamma-semialdehyde dehydrogenase PutA [Croceicoccus naphthovorans]AKM09499.1 transcriptional regulator [Croceicoccus naphthovorans]MBB3989768.1 RHH-type proline utilization regulon transcriptional repressor/proline dehydrogenase/delta 1-pyrroline-5-carboxylate dehydrogenase [Croceicoccus naphthovorans]